MLGEAIYRLWHKIQPGDKMVENVAQTHSEQHKEESLIGGFLLPQVCSSFFADCTEQAQ